MWTFVWLGTGCLGVSDRWIYGQSGTCLAACAVQDHVGSDLEETLRLLYAKEMSEWLITLHSFFPSSGRHLELTVMRRFFTVPTYKRALCAAMLMEMIGFD